MPWDARDTMSLRSEFTVRLAGQGEPPGTPSFQHFAVHRLQVASPRGLRTVQPVLLTVPVRLSFAPANR
jgi:hypothetical protein